MCWKALVLIVKRTGEVMGSVVKYGYGRALTLAAGCVLAVMFGAAAANAGEAFEKMQLLQANAAAAEAKAAEPVQPVIKKVRLAKVRLPPPAVARPKVVVAAAKRPRRTPATDALQSYPQRVAVRRERPTVDGSGKIAGLAGCIPGALRTVLAQVESRYGAVHINSSYRSPARNRRVGGAKHSLHMACRAVDFRVAGNGRAVLGFIKSSPLVGGYKRYRSGYFHIDTGPRRTWPG